MNAIILHGAGERGKERVMSFVLSALKIVAETAVSVTGVMLNGKGAFGPTIASSTASIGKLAGDAASKAATQKELEEGTAMTLGDISAGLVTTGLNVAVLLSPFGKAGGASAMKGAE